MEQKERKGELVFAENGEKVRETHLTFPDLQALLKALSPKRLELLQRQDGGVSAPYDAITAEMRLE